MPINDYYNQWPWQAFRRPGGNTSPWGNFQKPGMNPWQNYQKPGGDLNWAEGGGYQNRPVNQQPQMFGGGLSPRYPQSPAMAMPAGAPQPNRAIGDFSQNYQYGPQRGFGGGGQTMPTMPPGINFGQANYGDIRAWQQNPYRIPGRMVDLPYGYGY